MISFNHIGHKAVRVTVFNQLSVGRAVRGAEGARQHQLNDSDMSVDPYGVVKGIRNCA